MADIELVESRWMASRHKEEWISSLEWANGDRDKAWRFLRVWGWKWNEETEEYDSNEVIEALWQAFFACMVMVVEGGNCVPTHEEGDVDVLGVSFKYIRSPDVSKQEEKEKGEEEEE